MHKKHVITVLLTMALNICFGSVFAQSAPSVAHAHAISLEHLYWHFLEYQLYLVRKPTVFHHHIQMFRPCVRITSVG